LKRGPIILAVGLIVVGVLVAVLASGFQHDPRAITSPLLGKAAPDFTLQTLEPDASGTTATVKLSAQHGTPVVINFWATWCIPCQQEHSTLLAVSREFNSVAKFYGVVYQDKPEAIDAWLKARGRAYPTLIDVGSQAAIAFGVYGVPETFVIDKKGIIREKFTGGVTFDGVASLLNTLIAE
jgi:cytochrome c biogenesis protein CcmG/thiol:disulfide interchange protein DsbE